MLQGVSLFACVPLVLWVLLVQPLGPGWSLELGIAIITAHRAVAAPRAARHAMKIRTLGILAVFTSVTTEDQQGPYKYPVAKKVNQADDFFGTTI